MNCQPLIRMLIDVVNCLYCDLLMQRLIMMKMAPFPVTDEHPNVEVEFMLLHDPCLHDKWVISLSNDDDDDSHDDNVVMMIHDHDHDDESTTSYRSSYFSNFIFRRSIMLTWISPQHMLFLFKCLSSGNNWSWFCSGWISNRNVGFEEVGTIRLYCDLLMQQVYNVKMAVQDREHPNVEHSKYLTSKQLNYINNWSLFNVLCVYYYQLTSSSSSS